MSFYVSYPDGREIITDGMYFTTTTTVTVIVRDSSVEVTASLVGAPELLGSTYVTTKGGAAHSN
ncbi:hypothetical protein [Pseudomonas lopnurensis]|uniref:hypothetical protein n=1 Tax=Pseudomonas lopnurensis TaxID=1477517 RepID=UPI0028A7087D|nr:hypothetical protein [Pseudomonas lopnurensis]